MDLNMLKLGLMLIILIWSIYSGITYMARRSDNKGALRDLRQDGQPARRMTDEEQALVQPFLFDPAKPKKQAQLINDGVYPLHGAFVRHGIEASQGGSTMHDTLGDVDVVLPYDARSYLVENNHAEVVLTEKFAIVVALNGEFDLAGGRERELRRQKQDQQWNSGRTGALQNVVDLRSTRPRRTRRRPRPSSWLRPSASWTTPRGSRSWRSATRRRPKWPRVRGAVSASGCRCCGPWPSCAWGWRAGRGMPFAAGAGALAALALWLTWRRPVPAAQKVNRARAAS